MTDLNKASVIFFDRQEVSFFQESRVLFFNVPMGQRTVEGPPVGLKRSKNETNMYFPGQMVNNFEVTEIRAVWGPGDLGMYTEAGKITKAKSCANCFADSYIEFCIGSWCPLTVPLPLLETPLVFDLPYLICAKQNFCVSLYTNKTAQVTGLCSIGLKGIYHFPAQ